MLKACLEWNGEKGASHITTKLTNFFPIYFSVTSTQSEFVSRLMLEINNDNVGNTHNLK